MSGTLEVGIKLTLEGLAEYRAGLREANEATRRLGVESRLALAELGNNAKASDRYSTNLKSLGSQLVTARDNVGNLQRAEGRLKDTYEEQAKNFKNHERDLISMQNQRRQAKSTYDALVKSQGESATATQNAKKQYEALLATEQKMTAEHSKMQTALGRTARELEKAPRQLKQAQLEAVTLQNQMDRVYESYRKNGGVLIDQAESLAKFGKKAQEFGEPFSALGDKMTKWISIPVATTFGKATHDATRFATEIGSLAPLMAEGGRVTGEMRREVERLGQSSLKWSRDYGVATTEINSGMAELVRNGYNASQVSGMIPPILDATIASGESFNTVMGTTANVIAQFGLKSQDTATQLKNTTRVVDSLTYVANATSSGFHELGQGMAYVGPIAHSLNMSVEETASILGILSDAGIDASMGGTALRGALTALINPTKAQTEAFAELGISTEDFRNGLIDFPTVLDMIADSTKHLTGEQRAALIAQAFGRQSQTAMNALVNEGGDALRNMTAEAENATGATERMASQMKELPEFKFKQLKESLKGASIALGNELLPHVLKGVDWLTKLANKFSDLDGGVIGTTAKFAGLVAVIGPVLSGIGSMAKNIGFLTEKALVPFVKWIGGMLTPLTLAEAGTGKLGQAMLSLNPKVLGVTLALGGLALAYKTLTSDSYKAKRAMLDFPDISGITHEQAESLRKVNGEVGKLSAELDTLGVARDYSGLHESLATIGEETTRVAEEKIQKLWETFDRLPPKIQESYRASFEQVEAEIRASANEVNRLIDEINTHADRATEKTGKDKEAEIYVAQGLARNMLYEYANVVGETEEQVRQIRRAVTLDMKEQNFEQLGDRLNHLDSMVEYTKEAYNQQAQDYDTMLKNGMMTRTAHTQEMLRLEKSTNEQLEIFENQRLHTALEQTKRLYEEKAKAYQADLIEQGVAHDHALKLANEKRKEYQEQAIRDVAESLQITVDEATRILNTTNADGMVKNLVNAFHQVSDGLNIQAARWNSAIANFAHSVGKSIDEITFDDVKNNAKEMEQALLNAGLTWNSLEFLTKNANIDDNTREVLTKLLELSREWDAFNREPIVLEFNTWGEDHIKEVLDHLGVSMDELKDKRVWELVLKSKGAKELTDILHEIGLYNQQELKTHQLTLKADNVWSTFKMLFELSGLWDNHEFMTKLLDVDTNAPEAKQELIEFIQQADNIDDTTKQLMIDILTHDADLSLTELANKLGQLTLSDWQAIVTGVGIEEVAERSGIALEVLQKIGALNPNVEITTNASEVTEEYNNLDRKTSELDGKTVTVNTSAPSADTDAQNVGLFNDEVERMQSNQAEASTTANVDADTDKVDRWNVTTGEMKDSKATARTHTPSIGGNTQKVDTWNTTSGNMRDRSSTATTRTPAITGNTQKVDSWIATLGSTYDKTSTLRTYVDTVYRTYHEVYGAAEGGHFGVFAEGGHVKPLKWGGMFAKGADRVPRGFMGIVGEAGPELFHVTNSGVSITPLAPGEKMRGIAGAIEDYLGAHEGSGGNNIVINIDVNSPVIREEQDIDKLTTTIANALTTRVKMENIFAKGV